MLHFYQDKQTLCNDGKHRADINTLRVSTEKKNRTFYSYAGIAIQIACPIGTKVNPIFQLWDFSKTLFTYKLKMHMAFYFLLIQQRMECFISGQQSKGRFSRWKRAGILNFYICL
jgi:hypothetical protein